MPRSFKGLTATTLGHYIYQQCERQLYYHLLPEDSPERPPERPLAQEWAERGREHEAAVMEWYRSQGLNVVRAGGFRLDERFESTCELIQQGEADIIYQGCLWPTPLFRRVYSDLPCGVTGLPDILKKTARKARAGYVRYEVGDIKASTGPALYQKYQIAFYSHLLYYVYLKLYQGQRVVYPVQGFIVPLAAEGEDYTEERFDLDPFRCALDDLLHDLPRILNQEPEEAAWHLRYKCEWCGYFDHCRAQAVRERDLSLIPLLREPQKRRLRQEGVTTVEQAAELEPARYRGDWVLARDAEQIRTHARALRDGQILFKETETSLLPAGVDVALFLTVETDPLHDVPYLYGVRVVEEGQTRLEREFLAETPTAERETFAAFLEFVTETWESCRQRNQRAHVLFYDGFDEKQLQKLWEKYLPDDEFPGDLTFLEQLLFSDQGHSTNLYQVVAQCLALPVETAYSLPNVARALGYPGPFPAHTSFSSHLSLNPIHQYWYGDSEAARQLARQELRAHLTFTLEAAAHVYQALTRLLSLKREKTSMELEPLPQPRTSLRGKLLTFVRTERDAQQQEILEFQRRPEEERVVGYRCIGGLQYQGAVRQRGRLRHVFTYDEASAHAKFRDGDVLRINPRGAVDLQTGPRVALVENDWQQRELVLEVRPPGPDTFDPHLVYTLDEDAQDFNFYRRVQAIHEAFAYRRQPSLFDLLNGKYNEVRDEALGQAALQWLEEWQEVLRFDESQQQAFLLPFLYDLSLIQGPPGTGKTHVLAWILLAQVLLAQQQGRSMRIFVTALSHKAINNVLRKVAGHVNDTLGGTAPCPILKLASGEGEEDDLDPGNGSVVPVQIDGYKTPFPHEQEYFILGATAFKMHSTQKSGQTKEFPRLFDLVACDEASQVQVPDALLAMNYGRGKFLFVGDQHQMPPIIYGHYPDGELYHKSIFVFLQTRRAYKDCRAMLEVTYRMNREITEFSSQTFYYGKLGPHDANADLRLTYTPATDSLLDSILHPDKAVVLVETDDQFSQQRNVAEVELVVELVARLVGTYGVRPDQIAVIAPHRAQNNEIAARLAARLAVSPPPSSPGWGGSEGGPGMRAGNGVSLPLIDTVERIQGQERDVILVSLTASDPDYVLAEADFLMCPNRLNVALTRAIRKLIVIGSRSVFRVLPHDEAQLCDASFLKKFRRHCERFGRIIPVEGTRRNPEGILLPTRAPAGT